jgi:integrase
VGLTTAALLAGYEAWQRGRGFSEATLRRRRKTLGWLAAYAAPTPLAEVDRDTIERWAAQHGKPRTRHAYLSDARMFYRWAVRHGHLAVNPCDLIDGPRLPKGLPRPLSRDELDRALETVGHDQRLFLILLLGAYAGLRAAEIAGLDHADVWLHATPPMLIVRGGKGGKDRAVPMHPALVEDFGPTGPISGPVFPRGDSRSDGEPISAAWVSVLVAEHFRSLGISGSCHRLRHTFGTEAARVSGGDVIAIASLMGHTNLATTMNYVALAGGRAAEVTSRLYGAA